MLRSSSAALACCSSYLRLIVLTWPPTVIVASVKSWRLFSTSRMYCWMTAMEFDCSA